MASSHVPRGNPRAITTQPDDKPKPTLPPGGPQAPPAARVFTRRRWKLAQVFGIGLLFYLALAGLFLGCFLAARAFHKTVPDVALAPSPEPEEPVAGANPTPPAPAGLELAAEEPAEDADEGEGVGPPAEEPAQVALELLPPPTPAGAVLAANAGEFVGPPAPPRLCFLTEEELSRQLAQAPEVGLGHNAQAVFRSYKDAFTSNVNLLGTVHASDPTPLFRTRPDLRNLPYVFDASNQLDGKAAQALGTLSRKLHAALDLGVGLDGQKLTPEGLLRALKAATRGNKPEWLRAEALPTLMQLLMFEDVPLRHVLVEMLAQVKDRPATVDLARRAVFDLDREVRMRAVEALQERPREDARPVLLKALRYPWAPAADHAAEALVALEDRDAVPSLVSLLRQTDPSAPETTPSNKVVLQELVRVNHRSNCLMCHPPSVNLKEPVLGLVPGVINHNTVKTAGGYVSEDSPAWIRADVIFLHQEMSSKLPLRDALPKGGGANPVLDIPLLRFDFLVRTRVLTPKQAEKLSLMKPDPLDPLAYPQRKAVLFALRLLTGKDAGNDTEAWLALYPQAEAEAEATRLAQKLIDAPAGKREQILEALRDGKGAAHSRALARAIPQLSGDFRERARRALADRLMSKEADSLHEKLQGADPEVRRAALRAGVLKGDKALIPDLIDLTDSPEPETARLACEGLKTLTKEKHATPDAWKAWWKEQNVP